MSELWFYHLERSSLEEVLPELLEKTLARGWRALVRSPDARRREAIDKLLWTWRDDSFTPHAQAGGSHDARQPILIAEDEANPNGAKCLFLLDGAEPQNPAAFERMIVMFDGHDEIAVQEARQLWKQSAGQGIAVSYWRQSPEGRWEKKA